ncbi:MAG: zinc ribbon domain-containing protein, partial [Ruminiclostridium sp.]
IIILAIVIIVAVIKHKLNSMTRQYLGMGLGETADFLKKGIAEEATTPKAISNLSAVYKPKLMRDFPDMTYGQFEETAKNTLISVLNSIQAASIDGLLAPTDNLKKKVEGIINANAAAHATEHYDNIRIHRVSIADYHSTEKTAEAVFELSFQCNHFIDNGKNTKTDDTLTQMAAKVVLIYGADEYEYDSSVLSHNCPNCGAPIQAVGSNKACPYCGTGITEASVRCWLADSFSIIK